MDLENKTGFDGPRGLCRAMGQSVGKLIAAAEVLRDALVHHRVSEVWKLLAEHERELAALDQLTRLWTGIYDAETFADDAELAGLRFKTREAFKRLQVLERVNARLSRGYLNVIHKTLSTLSGSLAPKKKVYDARGRRERTGPSVFVSRIG